MTDEQYNNIKPFFKALKNNFPNFSGRNKEFRNICESLGVYNFDTLTENVKEIGAMMEKSSGTNNLKGRGDNLELMRSVVKVMVENGTTEQIEYVLNIMISRYLQGRWSTEKPTRDAVRSDLLGEG